MLSRLRDRKRKKYSKKKTRKKKRSLKLWSKKTKLSYKSAKKKEKVELKACIKNTKMLAKLSIRNVKRSFSDYSIYFLTLTFGVSLFYAFNSIGAQQAMLDLSNNQIDLMGSMMKSMAAASVLISFILAFLILYANQFLVKRRKKELGVYKTLGMSQFDISTLFLMETVVVGLFSLASGLALGTVMSQGFSILSSSVFDADLINYKFVFSPDAMMKTIVFFSIIFIVVIIFNTIIISRLKLLELLNGSKKNESIKVKNPKVGFILFVISVIMIVVSYNRLIILGIEDGLKYIEIFTVVALVGTFLFFFSLSSFVLSVIQSKKNIYFKDLNMFLVRQVGSKINTNFVVVTLICIMLTCSLTVLSGSFGYKKSMDEELKLVSPYDVTMIDYIWDQEGLGKPNKNEKLLKSKNINLNDFKDYQSLYYYDTGLNAPDLLNYYISKKQYNEYSNIGADSSIYAISQSDYIKLVQLQGKKPIKMGEDETVIFTNIVSIVDGVQSLIDRNGSISIGNKEYKIANKSAELLSIENTEVPRTMLMLVLPDKSVKTMDKKVELFVAKYQDNDKLMNTKLTKILDESIFSYDNTDSENTFDDFEDEVELDSNEADMELDYEILPYTKTYVYELSQGYTGTIIFLAIYIGTIFLISSAAILTLQQLSEASDNVSRYTMLQRVGVSRKSIDEVIFKQIFIYFMMPLVVAISHSIIAVKVINNHLIEQSSWSIIVPALVAGSVLLIIYGVYFLLTYKTYKSIVK